MSTNLHCYIKVGSCYLEEISLIQTPSEETRRILGGDMFEMKDDWKQVTKRYLKWLETDVYPDHKKNPWYETVDRMMLKYQKKQIGEAWKKAEELGGQLFFEGW